ncbi:MAG: hypothetical protein ACRCX8_06800 [Sarcina sp.]
MDLKNVKKVCFVFENIECLTFPKEVIEQLELKEMEGRYGTCYEVEATVVINDNVILGLFDELDNPIERMSRYSDITSVQIVDLEDKTREYYVKWDYSNEYDNSYQKSKFLEWNKVKISIKKDNKTYTLEDLLSGDFEDGCEFKDEDGKVYEIENKNENVFLKNEIVSRDLLEKIFREV